MKVFKFILLQALVMLSFCDVQSQTMRINFTAPKAYPEGTAYYNTARVFFVSSVTTGTIGKVDLNGNYMVFYEDPSLKSSYGMKVDEARHKLWVCTGDANYSIYSTPSTYQKLIRLISLDLTSGQKIDDINLSNLVDGKHFANDLTLDADGNIYITDSFSPVIYKVNTKMQPSVLVSNEMFESVDVGLNGIVWNPRGYLIAVHSTNGALYKIPLNNPDAVEKVITGTFFSGGDGLWLDKEGNLSLVQNKGTNKIFAIQSRDDWKTAKVVAGTKEVDRFANPTTITRKDNQLYALNAKLNELANPALPPSKEFSLQLVRFISMK